MSAVRSIAVLAALVACSCARDAAQPTQLSTAPRSISSVGMAARSPEPEPQSRSETAQTVDDQHTGWSAVGSEEQEKLDATKSKPGSPVPSPPEGFQIRADQIQIVNLRVTRRLAAVRSTCGGDCALGDETFSQLFFEQASGQLFTCLPNELESTLEFELGLDDHGKVLNPRLLTQDAPREAPCVLKLVRNSTYPPGSDPKAVVKLFIYVRVTRDKE